MKQCKDCKETKPFTEFHKGDKLKSCYITGKYLSSYCKGCHVIRNRPSAARTRQKKIEIRQNEFNVCSCCGLDDWVVMEFHHSEDDKEGNCSDIKGLGKWLNEVRKCLVLCANCHRRLHSQSTQEDFFG